MNWFIFTLRCAYLRLRIRSAERDAEMHAHWAVLEPLLAASARQHAEALQVQLAILTLERSSEH